jgi:hypothetical protein
MAIMVSASISILLLFFLFRFFFQDLRDFTDHLKFLFIPDLVSAFRGEYEEDRVSSFKVVIYLGFSLGPGLVTFFIIR